MKIDIWVESIYLLININIFYMKMLIKKVLTDKKARSGSAMSAYVMTVTDIGTPWAH